MTLWVLFEFPNTFSDAAQLQDGRTWRRAHPQLGAPATRCGTSGARSGSTSPTQPAGAAPDVERRRHSSAPPEERVETDRRGRSE